MKKYLLIGLVIIMGTNLVVLGGVAFNRSGDITSHLTLTERELPLPYNTGSQKENSGVLLSINWRTASKANNTYYPYNASEQHITKDELLALGFENIDKQSSNWTTPLELYWALEFDGALHKAEIKKAEAKYQKALLAYNEQANDENKRKEKQFSENLAREKTSNSRLFFIEAAADYELLAAKFSNQNNMLIVKGLTNYYYNKKDDKYSLNLNHLSIGSIMAPLEHTDVFSGLQRQIRNGALLPRYTVTVKWGARLEPWITNTKRVVK